MEVRYWFKGREKSMEKKMIRHTVVFTLKHLAGSAAEENFITAARKLENIPGVKKFEVLKQIGKKNDYKFGLSMEFVDEIAYQGYNDHSEHVAFVQNHWVPEVAAFMEIDYIPKT
jgi:Stress responsive A/B Barrel Domain